MFAPVLLLAALSASDVYTLYELGPPETHSFAIVYDFAQTREGERFLLNPVRAGSTASKERVVDRSTGKELKWELVEERGNSYVKVHLPGPVAKNGETRVRIYKTYTDAPSYFEKDGLLVFDRPFGVKRNTVVLPAGYELTGSAAPGIVSSGADGRIHISFYNDRDDQMPVKITARRMK
jgi:hypothetical protein